MTGNASAWVHGTSGILRGSLWIPRGEVVHLRRSQGGPYLDSPKKYRSAFLATQPSSQQLAFQLTASSTQHKLANLVCVPKPPAAKALHLHPEQADCLQLKPVVHRAVKTDKQEKDRGCFVGLQDMFKFQQPLVCLHKSGCTWSIEGNTPSIAMIRVPLCWSSEAVRGAWLHRWDTT